MYIGTNSPKMSAKFYIIEIITPGYYFFFFPQKKSAFNKT